jgi:hypothetical protein
MSRRDYVSGRSGLAGRKGESRIKAGLPTVQFLDTPDNIAIERNTEPFAKPQAESEGKNGSVFPWT